MGRWRLICVALAVSCSRPAPTAEEIYAKATMAVDEERFKDALAMLPSETELAAGRIGRPMLDRLRLMRAELLALRPDGREGMQFLQQPLAPGAEPELERRRRRSLGYGRCRTARTVEERRAGLAILEALQAETAAGSGEAAQVGLRRGACLRAMGLANEAEAALQEALRAARAAGDGAAEAQILSSLGTIYAAMERFDEAAAVIGRSLRVAEQAGLRNRPVVRRAEDNLGWLQYELGDYERAFDTLRRFRPQRAGERVVNENNQARTLFAMGDPAGAEEHYKRALEAARGKAGVDATDEVTTMYGLAMLFLHQGKPAEAARWSREAAGLQTKLKRADLERFGWLLEARIRRAEGDAGRAEPLLRRVLADAASSRQLRWTAHLELARLQAAAGQMGPAEAAVEQAIAAVEEGQSTLRAAEDRMAFLSSRMDVYREMLQIQMRQGRTQEALRTAARSRNRAGRGGVAKRSAGRAAPMLFYWLDEPQSHLWVVAAGRSAEHYRLPGEKEIGALVEAHNQMLLRARDPLTEGGQEARRLYAILVEPARKHLQGQRVRISPDGALHALNFETLVAPGPDRYWVADMEVVVAQDPDGPEGGTGPRSREILLTGDAEAGETGPGRLRHAGAELDGIGRLFGATPLLGAAATPGAVTAAMAKDPGYVHFSAHAEANRLRPLESAIVFSPEGASSKLYAREVAAMRLRAHLVTLSACTAAGAKAYKGEGLVGFAWAFLGAGAENVVASLWEVDDASTPELMRRMYEQLQRGRTPGQALREAKLELLRSATALRKPYFWGAFLHFQR
jgi:CHAT domain-containing protein